MGYEPGEAAVKLKGGNSNWRGPVWFPTSYLLIHSFLRFGDAVGHELAGPDRIGRVGPRVALAHVAAELAEAAALLLGLDALGNDGDAQPVGE